MQVTKQVGEYSYLVSLKDTSYEVHLDQLKPYKGEILEGEPTKLMHRLGGYKNLETEEGEYEVECILRHRYGKDGKLEFLTRWEGYEPGSETWEPVSHFVMKYCVKLVQYLRKNGLRVDLGASLRDVPSP